VPPVPGFLENIVELCRRHGALSIFDEVITGCRLAPGGAQEHFGVRPDLTCLGKIVGGGMPLALYGGRRDVMSQISPLGPVYQAGTLSGNPIAVSAALATLAALDRDAYAKLDRLGQSLGEGLERALRDTRTTGIVQRLGSMLTLFFNPGPVQNWNQIKSSDTQRFARFHRGLLDRSVYFPPSQFETAFVSLAHTEDEIERTIEAVREALSAS
jgi:glutamate-1-semialdehyde 2,1-aminomutase